jgi:hypothetical protein
MNQHSETLTKYGFEKAEGFEGKEAEYIKSFLDRLR